MKRKKLQKPKLSEGMYFYLLVAVFFAGLIIGAFLFSRTRLVVGFPVERKVPSAYPRAGGIRI